MKYVCYVWLSGCMSCVKQFYPLLNRLLIVRGRFKYWICLKQIGMWKHTNYHLDRIRVRLLVFVVCTRNKTLFVHSCHFSSRENYFCTSCSKFIWLTKVDTSNSDCASQTRWPHHAAVVLLFPLLSREDKNTLFLW